MTSGPEFSPADKAEYVAAMRREGHTVLMVGDGINDSPALSEADAGIAISDGAAIAREIADITIAADSLWELVRLRQLAHGLNVPHPEQLPLCHWVQWGADRSWRGRHPASNHLRYAPQPVYSWSKSP